ncbi:MAG: hypothetical protein D6686_15285 [Alphaproteobacteria bacterium]|nr:MAG: hypothetical protein D6686_15285 [Alphaproteobacteria bacterium]
MTAGWRAGRARFWAGLSRPEEEPTLMWLRDATGDLSRASASVAGEVPSGRALGAGLGLHHDGAAEQLRIGLAPAAAAQAGLMLSLGDFTGSYVSISIDCPAGPIPRGAVLGLWVAHDPDRARPVVRLNLQCGVDLERPEAIVSLLPEGVLAEFDLAGLPAAAAAHGWFDVIFPPMRHQGLRISALRIHMRRRAPV